MIIVVAEHVLSLDILNVEPAMWNRKDWNDKFPLALEAFGRRFLDLDPCPGAWVVAIQIQPFVIRHIDDVVPNITSTGSQSLDLTRSS